VKLFLWAFAARIVQYIASKLSAMWYSVLFN
jgi:hypothetical protein